jgi:DNA-binding PadR family transcriptional regulator
MRRHCAPGFEFGKFGPGVFGMRFGPRGFGFGGPGGGPFGGDWADEFGFGGGGRRGRRGRMFESGELRLVLLKLIADQPRHGYDLIRAIYAPSPGVVYPTLTMLEEMGLIAETPGEGARRPYGITAEGQAHLAERSEDVEALLERLEGAGEGKRRAGGRPIQRAVGNLLSALWHRVTADDIGEDRLHEIAAILDEAAQRIERLK